MWRQRDRLAELQTEVLLVSFESLERIRFQFAGAEFGWPVLSDETREGYGAFGLERAGWVRVWLSPRTLGFYARSLLRGRIPGKPQADTLQLGGDFIIDAGGVVRFAHRSVEPADRPPVDLLLQALRAIKSEDSDRKSP